MRFLRNPKHRFDFFEIPAFSFFEIPACNSIQVCKGVVALEVQEDAERMGLSSIVHEMLTDVDKGFRACFLRREASTGASAAEPAAEPPKEAKKAEAEAQFEISSKSEK